MKILNNLIKIFDRIHYEYVTKEIKKASVRLDEAYKRGEKAYEYWVKKNDEKF